MNKIAIIFKSRYGTTKQYAAWIAEDTGGDLFCLPKVSIKQLMVYDTIVFGGGLYAGGILCFSFFKKYFSKLSGKKLIVFAVGASFGNKKNIDSVKQHNMNSEMLDKVPFFFLRGGLNYPAMNLFDRFAMWCMLKIQQSKPEPEQDEESRAIIATYGKLTNFLDHRSISPILEALKK